MSPGPRCLLMLPLAGALGLASPADGVLCVAPGGTGGCFSSLAGALAAASEGETIRVAAGDYRENVLLDRTLSLEGGWNADFTERDPALFVSRILPSPGSTESVVSIQGTFGDSAATRPVLDGFTVTGGEGDAGGNHGGGIRIRNADAVVSHNVVTANRAYLLGGGIWVQNGAPRLEANEIFLNFVTGDVAGGGGVDLEGSQAVLVDNAIYENMLEGIDGGGAGVNVAGGGPVRIRGGRIEDNSFADACDGGGGGLLASNATALEVDGVLFAGNCAESRPDGAIGLVNTPARIANCVILRNFGYSGISIQPNSPTSVVNCTFRGEGSQFAGIDSNSALELMNNVFADYANVGVSVGAGIPVADSHNDFWNNASDASFSLDASNLSVDPLLDATHHLTAASPLIDAGVRTEGPFRDRDGDPRPMDGGSGRFRFDIGADEFPGPAQRVVDLAREEADLCISGPGNPPENPDSVGNSDWIGYSVLARDVSGDGAADLVFSAEDWAEDFDTLNATGRVFGLLNFGARRLGVLSLAAEPPDFQVVSRLENQHVGEELAAGDLDGDGLADLAIGSSQNDMDPDVVPTLFALRGGPGLAAAGATLEAGALGDLAVLGAEKNALSFATENGLAVGDLDGDGIDDLAVGDALADDGAVADAGAIYVFFGGPGLAGVRDLASGAADLTVYGPTPNGASFGSGPYLGGVALGDVDADGQTDLVARDANSAHVLFGPLAPGLRRLADAPGDLVVNGLDVGGVFVMDATADGRDDLLLEAAGDVHVIAGPLAAGAPLDAAGSAAFTLLGADPRAFAVGDLIGDRRPELLIGDPASRQVRVIPAGPLGPGPVDPDEVAALVVTGPFQGARNLGWDVSAGDLDGDGRDDLVAGAWQQTDPSLQGAEFQDVGKVVVVYGDAWVPCPAEPHSVCIPGAKGRLRVDERRPGGEKLSLKLRGLAAAVGAKELGDPVAGATAYDLCLYDDEDALVADLAVDRAGETCGGGPCWKPKGEAGLQYADRAASAAGVVKLFAKGGRAGKGRLGVAARNKVKKNQLSLPTGVTAKLAGAIRARAQLVTSDAACFELVVDRVKRADAGRFDAVAQ